VGKAAASDSGPGVVAPLPGQCRPVHRIGSRIVQNAAAAGDACTVVDEAAADLHLDAALMLEHGISFTWSDGCHSRPRVAVLAANALIAPRFVVASQRDAARSGLCCKNMHCGDSVRLTCNTYIRFTHDMRRFSSHSPVTATICNPHQPLCMLYHALHMHVTWLHPR
jgi:hypothetical protein